MRIQQEDFGASSTFKYIKECLESLPKLPSQWSVPFTFIPYLLLISLGEILKQWRLWGAVFKWWFASEGSSFGFSHACKTRRAFDQEVSRGWGFSSFSIPPFAEGPYEKSCWGRSGYDHFKLCSSHLGLLQIFIYRTSFSSLVSLVLRMGTRDTSGKVHSLAR